MIIKVAIILPYFGLGGAEMMVAHLVSNLDPNMVRAEVFCIYGKPQGNHLEQKLLDKKIKIHYIGKARGFSVKAIWRLGRELSSYNPDILHSHLYACVYAMPWLVFSKIQMLHTVHSLPEVENKRFIRKWLTRHLIRWNKMIPVAISKKNRRLIAEFYNIHPESIPVIHNPVDVKQFTCYSEQNNLAFTFITVGRLLPVKNQKMIINAFSRLQQVEPSSRLVVVGSGAEESALKRQACELGISDKIEFAGYVQDVERYLAKADVFVLASHYEGLPMSILEAMAAGMPVIATDVGGIADIITDNGILVPAGDEAAMAKAMLKLMSEPELRKEMGSLAKQYAAKYDINLIAGQYTALYRWFGRCQNDEIANY